MADDIDIANDRAELFLQSALYQQKRKEVPRPAVGIGVCLECLVEVEGDGRWCGPECRDDWEQRQAR